MEKKDKNQKKEESLISSAYWEGRLRALENEIRKGAGSGRNGEN